MINLAEKNNIPYQREVFTGGGTDAWGASMAGKGYLSGGLGIPQRYMHTAVGTVNMDDMENTVKLALEIVKNFKGL